MTPSTMQIVIYYTEFLKEVTDINNLLFTI